MRLSALPLCFADPAVVAGWYPIDDVVMGGMSTSRLRHDPSGCAVFEGSVSLAQGGGFASVRSPVADYGAAHAFGYALEVRGDGHRFKLALRVDDDFDGVSWQASFEPAPGVWSSVHLTLASFSATRRGRVAAGAAPCDPSRVRQLGLLIADRQAGAFSLGLRAIAPLVGQRAPAPARST